MTLSFRAIFFWLLLIGLALSCSNGDESSAEDPEDQADDDDDNDNTDDDDNDDNDDDDNDDDNDNDDLTEGPYYRDFLHYWQVMNEGYGYFMLKGVDWDGVYTQYEPEAFAETDLPAFQLMIAKITASLKDSHTASSIASVGADQLPYLAPTGVCLERSGENVYVSRLTEAAENAGVALGDELISLDNETVSEVLARAVSWEGCSSDHCCDFYRLPHVERFSPGEDSVLYTLRRGDAEFDVELSRDGYQTGTCKPQWMLDFLEGASGSVLKYKAAAAHIGYLQLDTLSDSSETVILADLDQALSDFAEMDGIIFDARYNHGGSDLVVMKVLSRFLGQTVWPVSFRYKNGPEHDDFTLWVPEPVLPGAAPMDLPVIFLINGGCVSAADFFAAAASYIPTFELLGTPSCGATGAPKHETMHDSGITFYYSQMQRKFLATGQQIEGIGIAPDHLVPMNPADMALGVDTQIQAALDLLLSR